jgi:hypothetical protein
MAHPEFPEAERVAAFDLAEDAVQLMAMPPADVLADIADHLEDALKRVLHRQQRLAADGYHLLDQVDMVFAASTVRLLAHGFQLGADWPLPTQDS